VGPRSGRGGEEKNFQALPGFESPIIQPVAQRYTAEISWLPKYMVSFSLRKLKMKMYTHDNF
jgi:hypothetical protein